MLANQIKRCLTPEQVTQLKQSGIWQGPRQDIQNVLALSDIFVYPSFYREGIPRALLEAASMGLPIVTVDSPGCREVVEPGKNGYIVPTRDSDALAHAIQRLIDDPDIRHRFGRESRIRVLECFDLPRIAEQTSSIYKDLLSRNGLLPGGEAL